MRDRIIQLQMTDENASDSIVPKLPEIVPPEIQVENLDDFLDGVFTFKTEYQSYDDLIESIKSRKTEKIHMDIKNGRQTERYTDQIITLLHNTNTVGIYDVDIGVQRQVQLTLPRVFWEPLWTELEPNQILISNLSMFEKNCLVADLTTARCWSIASMTQPHAHGGMVTLDKVVYVFGGETWFDTPTSWCENYEAGANEWIEIPPLPVPSSGMGATTLRGKIYVVGAKLEKILELNPGDSSYHMLPMLNPLPIPYAKSILSTGYSLLVFCDKDRENTIEVYPEGESIGYIDYSPFSRG